MSETLSPIETHPHDGSLSLVFYCVGGKIIWAGLARYHDVKGKPAPIGKGWWWLETDNGEARAASPSHWLPMPTVAD
jgi:hypothetical protein